MITVGWHCEPSCELMQHFAVSINVSRSAKVRNSLIRCPRHSTDSRLRLGFSFQIEEGAGIEPTHARISGIHSASNGARSLLVIAATDAVLSTASKTFVKHGTNTSSECPVPSKRNFDDQILPVVRSVVCPNQNQRLNHLADWRVLRDNQQYTRTRAA